MYKILFVDDNASYLKSMKTLLENAGYEVMTSESPITGVEILANNSIDLVISDLMMEEMSGNDFIKFVLEMDADLKTIILTGNPNDSSEVVALNNDVDYFLTKDMSAEVFLKYVQKLLKKKKAENKVYFSTSENLVLDIKERRVTKDDENIHLTPKEFEILKLFLSQKRQAISRADFIEKIWSSSVEEIDERAIDVHIKMLRRKLKISSIVSIRGFGYRWEE